jgi:photosystem II stability/assembly factor-like uncharacterized protein
LEYSNKKKKIRWFEYFLFNYPVSNGGIFFDANVYLYTMKINSPQWILLSTAFCICNYAWSQNKNIIQTEISLPVSSSIRAMHVLNDSVVWIGAARGIFALTQNGGKTWYVDSIKKDSAALDFRSLYAIDNNNCLLLNAGSPAFIFKVFVPDKTDTATNSEHVLHYQNDEKEIFFDAMGFKNSLIGYAIGDPINKKFIFLKTEDAGNTWKDIGGSISNTAAEDEALFAASNSTLVVQNTFIAFATGGSQSRIIYSYNDGKSWSAISSKLIQGADMQGAFSMDMHHNLIVVAGGDYDHKDSLCQNLVLFDVQKQFKNIPLTRTLHKMISCIKFHPCHENILLAACLPGIYLTQNLCNDWKLINNQSYNTLRWSPTGKLAYAAGADGKVLKLEFKD